MNDAQLVVAGVGAMVAAHQTSVARWEGPRSTARATVPAALAITGVSLTNYAGLRMLGSPASADWWLFARSASLCVLVVSLFPLATRFSDRPAPRWLIYPVGAVVVGRVVLWPTTNLIYVHQLVRGLPSYGPLAGPSALVIIGSVFAYLCSVAWRSKSERERLVLSTGIAASLVLAIVSVVPAESVGVEIATGYVPLPSLVALALLLWRQQISAFQLVAELAERQRVLAELGQVALTADLPAVRAQADRLIGAHHTGPPGQNHQFVVAVEAVVAAATANDRVRRELHNRATTDELTGLPNRTALSELIAGVLGDRETEASGVAVAFCDIDRLRLINDVYGHPVGDEVLKIAAHRLSEALAPRESLARFGGDVFVIVSPDATGPDEVSAFGKRLANVFERPIATSRVDTAVTASIGIATVTPSMNSYSDVETLLRDADTAMQDAKARGGAIIGRFNHTLRSAVVYRADLERRLAGAVGRGEILVHYQPIVALGDRGLVGFEALARWNHGGTVLPPADWIPVAEATGLIHEIGDEVLRQASTRLRMWVEAGHRLNMSVNVSARQLATPDFADLAKHTVLNLTLQGLLTLEVTESLAIDDKAIGLLQELRRHGVRIALDDFGTGYSALGAVSRLPVDSLKIDQSIVQRVDQPDGRAIVSATVGIARSLGIVTVAEGVETFDTHSALVDLGCAYGQGFHYGRPLDGAAATELLRPGLVNK